MSKTELEGGGPAFPTGQHPGMTLRDYFAAKAMQALLQRIPMAGEEKAHQAYAIADAMLKAR